MSKKYSDWLNNLADTNSQNADLLSLSKPPLKQSKPKKKLLCWSDSVTATTGFSTVSKHILNALYQTGMYEIDQLAINYFGDFYDKDKVPYCLVPARLNDARDPYGSQMFINSLQKKEYDIVLVINDPYVVEGVAKKIPDIRDIKEQRKQKPFSLVYYYPVDCRLLPEATSMIKVADRSVAYTNFAKKSSEAIDIHPTDVIYHGADINSFYPLSNEEKRACRKQYLGVESDDTFVFINVNRNSMRKDIARSILAFSEFRKKVTKNCLLYVHAKVVDGTGQGSEIDLRTPVKELGLDMSKDVIFPNKFSPAKGFPVKILNQLYNCADVFISSDLGEGFGLSRTDAMCCNVPVIAPNHTVAPEMFGDNRGYLVPCKEKIFCDNSGFREWANMEDYLEQMELAYKDWKADKTGEYPKGREKKRQDIIIEAKKFVEQYSWKNVCKEWIKLFDELKPSNPNKKVLSGELV